MFRCSFCNRSIGPGIQPTHVVTETRSRKYKDGSVGWEIVKKKIACPDCANSIRAATEANGRNR